MHISTYREELKVQVIDFVKRIWVELGRTVDLDGGEKNLATIPQTYQATGGEFWVVLNDDEQVVGTVALCPLGKHEGELTRLYLDSSCRGQGMGRDLVQRVIETAKEIGLRTIKLDTSKKLASAYNLFQKMGFKTTRDLGDKLQTVFMELDISEVN